MLLMATNGAQGGEAISCEIALISWLDTRGVVVDGIERANTDVAEEFRLDPVCSGKVRLKVAICWAGDGNKRKVIFLVRRHLGKMQVGGLLRPLILSDFII